MSPISRGVLPSASYFDTFIKFFLIDLINLANCKEMFINFLHNSNSSPNPIVIGNNIIERVENYKILGVIMNN